MKKKEAKFRCRYCDEEFYDMLESVKHICLAPIKVKWPNHFQNSKWIHKQTKEARKLKKKLK